MSSPASPAYLAAAALFAATLLGACFQPLPAEGLACSPSGECPAGQSCGPDGRCWQEQPDWCTPGSCGAEAECGPDGVCRSSSEDEEPELDTRPYVGHVLIASATPSLQVLGTLVSPRVVLTCKLCLGSASAAELLFATESAEQGAQVESITRHPSADLAALILQAPLSSTGLQLASMPPVPGSEYIAVVPKLPGPADLVRLTIHVQITDVSATAFGLAATRCTAAGGPTFASEGSGDVLLGLHRSVECGPPMPYEDVRLDAYAAWVGQQIQGAEPESCADADSSCSGECARFECSEGPAGVVTSCEPDNTLCSAEQYCSTDFLCRSCTPNSVRACGQCGEQQCDESGTWGPCSGLPLTLSCGSCGRNYCQLDGNYGGCAAVASLCSTGQTCDAQPGQFVCNAVTCSTAGRNQVCDLTGTAPPSTVNANTSWLTGSACPSGSCRNCTCSSSGTVSCTSGCIN